MEAVQGTADTTDESLLVTKIETLLQPIDAHSSFTCDELTISALILLSRSTQNEVYHSLWIQNADRFLSFCIRWSSQESIVDDSKKDSTRHLIPLRWTALWVQRLLLSRPMAGAPFQTNDNKLLGLLQSMRNLFWDVLAMEGYQQGTTLSTLETKIDISECLFCLEHSLSQTLSRERVDANLDLLSHLVENQGRQQHETFFPNKGPPSDLQSYEPILNQTLTKLLPSRRPDEEEQTEVDLWKLFEANIQGLILQQCKFHFALQKTTKSIDSLPAIWTRVLKLWWSKSSRESNPANQPRRKEWAKLLLEVLLEGCLAYQETSGTLDWETFWKDQSRWQCWTRLVVSSVTVDESHLAWTSVGQVIRLTGWKSLLRLDECPAWISTILRLAVGEVNIQLGKLGTAPDEEQEILLQVICDVVSHFIDLIPELVGNDDETGETSFPAEPVPKFLESVHRSFQEALHISAQYLNLAERRFTDVVDASVICLFGRLLTEFDIFQAAKKNGEDDNEYDKVRALTVAIQTCPSECRPDIIAGLITVLASAEGDAARVKVLAESNVVNPNLMDLLQSPWREDNVALIPICSNAIDGLLNVFPSASTTPLREALIDWISCVCAGCIDDERRSALQESVSCYIRLQGSIIPSDKDKRIIQQALEIVGKNVEINSTVR